MQLPSTVHFQLLHSALTPCIFTFKSSVGFVNVKVLLTDGTDVKFSLALLSLHEDQNNSYFFPVSAWLVFVNTEDWIVLFEQEGWVTTLKLLYWHGPKIRGPWVCNCCWGWGAVHVSRHLSALGLHDLPHILLGSQEEKQELRGRFWKSPARPPGVRVVKNLKCSSLWMIAFGKSRWSLLKCEYGALHDCW